MPMDRRAALARMSAVVAAGLPGALVPAPIASASNPAGAPPERRVRKIATEEAFCTRDVAEALRDVLRQGGANLDLRQATFAAREVVITVNAFMGGASIIVGPHTHVVVEGIGIMGGYSGPSGLVDAVLDESSPTVRIKGVAVWGGVSVERKQMPGPGRGKRLDRA